MKRRCQYTPAQSEQIDELKRAGDERGFHFAAAETPCRMIILGRGEVAFYQRGERALLFELLAGRGVIFRESIRCWSSGERVSEAERQSVIDHVTIALRQLGFETVHLA